MGFKDKLERKLSRVAIPHLTLWIIIGQVLFFVLHFSHPNIIDRMYLDAAMVWAGQWWRVFSPINSVSMPKAAAVFSCSHNA